MKVALISVDNPYRIRIGGKHVHLLLLEKGLKSNGVDILTIYPSVIRSQGLRKVSSYLFAGLESLVFRDPLHPYKRYILGIEDLLRKATSERKGELSSCDILHFHDTLSLHAYLNFNGNCCLDGMHYKRRTILTLHGYFPNEFIDYTFVPKLVTQKLYKFLMDIEKKAISKADFVIAVDRRLGRYAIEDLGCDESRVEVLPNAVDTDTFSPVTDEQKSKLRQEVGIDANYVILVPRRLVPKNGVVYAVRSLKALQNRLPNLDVKMLIAGVGPLWKSLRDEIKRLGLQDKCIMLGSISHDEIERYFKISDFIMIPSVSSHGVEEATSLAALEGMSCGKVVIASQIGGLKEIIIHKKTGLLVNESDPESLADAVSYLIKNPEEMHVLSDNARNYVVANHSFFLHARRVLELYNKLLSER